MAVDYTLSYLDKTLQKSGTEDPNVILPPTPPDTDSNSTSSESSKEPSNKDYTISFPLPPPANTNILQVLPEDKKTPDNHVPRDSRLIRLTGVHPFNVEPPLSDLFNEGFLTSPELFYVRNHGAVPQVHDEEIPNWEFSVEGHVKKPFKLTLRELIEQYEQITVPITLVCAGNRRKEQNMVRKSKGFSWGAAGVSTALWTGVPLYEMIKRAMPKRGAKYVCMEGADKLPNGYYGTSVKLNWALDPNKGIMLAHGMNGEMLTPDHGKPLRVVVPGQIGGRSVKWLKKLIITQEPSDNWYHIYDNRVLPTMVSPEESANDESWWRDERYAIYDLSTNSAIAYPAHDEVITLPSPSSPPKFYTTKGYAYGGGGRRVSRVEITLDKGKNWLLANIQYYEDSYRDHSDENQKLFGGRLDMSWRETCFCWCFWSLDIPIEKLRDSQDIMVRAMDDSMNVQPRDMYWSVLGMMNNPWFRVTITHSPTDNTLLFSHPTQPALIPGGWMQTVKTRGGNLSNGFWGESIPGEELSPLPTLPSAVIKMTKDSINKELSIEELLAHEDEKDPWFVLNGQVYDGTSFLESHPGGATSITAAAAQDVTDEFMAIHSETAKSMMSAYHIGRLSPSALKALTMSPETVSNTANTLREVFLDSKKWMKASLAQKKNISSDTRIFTFNLDHPSQKIGLPTGQHLMLRLQDPVTRELIIRPYTPLSLASQLGTLDILIKVYFPPSSSSSSPPTSSTTHHNQPQNKELESQQPKQKSLPDPAGGKMTMALDSLPIGHPVEFKGPIGKFTYHGHGHCTIASKPRQIKKFYMICGGSGITPVFQVLRVILDNADDGTECVLLDGNRTQEDILCGDELGALVSKEDLRENGEKGKGRFKLIHTLTKPNDSWTGLKGRVGKELLEKEIGKKREGSTEEMVLVCGPEALETAVRKELTGLGWGDDDLLFF